MPLWCLLAVMASPEVYIGTTLALLALGIAAASRVARARGLADPGVVVIDEVVGLLVTMTFIEPTLATAALGFVLFRALDVLKPLGIARLEGLPGGYGIMMDDFAAGVLGNVCLRVLIDLPEVL